MTVGTEPTQSPDAPPLQAWRILVLLVLFVLCLVPELVLSGADWGLWGGPAGSCGLAICGLLGGFVGQLAAELSAATCHHVSDLWIPARRGSAFRGQHGHAILAWPRSDRSLWPALVSGALRPVDLGGSHRLCALVQSGVADGGRLGRIVRACRSPCRAARAGAPPES